MQKKLNNEKVEQTKRLVKGDSVIRMTTIMSIEHLAYNEVFVLRKKLTATDHVNTNIRSRYKLDICPSYVRFHLSEFV